LPIPSLVLPANAKISKDAKETVQECLLDFISFVTGVHQLVGVHQLRQLHQFINFVWVENEESDREGDGERENKIK
jgi:hypothetical protein